jgi:hypothetical protein
VAQYGEFEVGSWQMKMNFILYVYKGVSTSPHIVDATAGRLSVNTSWEADSMCEMLLLFPSY